jgi:putative transposase
MTDSTTPVDDAKLFLGEAWLDPIEAGIRDRIRGFIEELIEEELAAALGRGRYQRRHRRGDNEAGSADTPPAAETAGVAPLAGHRHGHRQRRLCGSFGTVEIAVPRARVGTAGGGTAEWKSRALPRYARMTKQVEALIAGTYLAGTNTRRVRRALAALFKGAIGKDAVSRIWRKVKTDWEAWSKRPLDGEDIVRLILDGTVVRVRLDKKATSISLLVVLGVRRDGQKVLLAVKNMGGESEAAWRVLLDDLVARRLKTPELLIVDGAAGLEKALAALWPQVPTQRCTVHKHRNLLAHAPDHLHEEVSADYTDMIYAATPKEVEERRKAFLRKWRLKCRAVGDSLEEAGERLFTFTRLPPGQWRSARTSNAVERLHEEFKRRIKTQTVLPSPETAAMLFWALLASGQITMRKVDGWQTLATKPTDAVIDLAA